MFKLTKMLKLIQNEYLKLLKKKSTWAILIIVAVLAVGFCALFTINTNYNIRYDDYYNYSLQNEADNFLNHQYKDYGFDFKNANGEYTNQSDEAISMRKKAVYYRFVIENNLERNDWRVSTGLVEELCNYNYDMVNGNTAELKEDAAANYNKLKADFDADNWKGYYEDQLAVVKESYKDDQLLLEASSWFYEYAIANDIKPGVDIWKDSAISIASGAKLSLIPLLKQEAVGEKIDADKKEELLNTAAVAIYRVEHNIENDLTAEVLKGSYGVSTMWGVFSQSKGLVTVIGVLVIVIAGSIVSSEFAQGTIKFLLINPVKRWKILVAKYITAISYGVILLLVLYFITGICSMLFTGFAGVTDKLIVANGGVAHSVSPLVTIMKQYLLSGINVVVMATLAFALSSVARSSALAVSISMLLLLVGSIVLGIFYGLEIDWARYLIFANLDLVNIYNGNSLFPNQSFPLAIFIIVMHIIIFFMIAWDGFTRKEV